MSGLRADHGPPALSPGVSCLSMGSLIVPLTCPGCCRLRFTSLGSIPRHTFQFPRAFTPGHGFGFLVPWTPTFDLAFSGAASGGPLFVGGHSFGLPRCPSLAGTLLASVAGGAAPRPGVGVRTARRGPRPPLWAGRALFSRRPPPPAPRSSAARTGAHHRRRRPPLSVATVLVCALSVRSGRGSHMPSGRPPTLAPQPPEALAGRVVPRAPSPSGHSPTPHCRACVGLRAAARRRRSLRRAAFCLYGVSSHGA